MINILNYIQGKRKTSSSGWTSFNAPCCIHNGETQDKRMRGGVKFSNDTDFSYHCFNCGYTASFRIGYAVSYKLKKLLSWMGVPELEINRLSLESLRNRDMMQVLEDRKEKPTTIDFDKVKLPDDARLIDDSDVEILEYIDKRQVSDFPFLTDPSSRRKGVIVPYTYKEKIVGYTTRFLDDRKPKYLNNQQHGYVFGYDLQKPNWQLALATEGIFDALSINGLALMHNDINESQAQLLRTLHREIIVVPDQDQAGLKLIERAIEYGFSVSIPDWDEGVKDINDAVQKYGKLATIVSILNNKNTSKIKIELAKRALEKRISA